MARQRTLFGLGLILLGMVFAPARAEANRAIVLSFEGWRAAEIRAEVGEAIANEVELVDAEEAIRAAYDLGIDISRPEGMAQVVDAMGITLVVAGTIEGRGARARATLRVLDPDGGELSRRDDVDVRRVGLAAIGLIRDAVLMVVPPAVEPDPPPLVEERPPVEVSREPEVEEQEPAELASAPKIFEIRAGLRVRTARSVVRAADASQPEAGFTADPFPELALELVFRPFAEGPADEELRGVFFAARGGVSVGLAYRDDEGAEHAMTSARFRFDVGYGHRVHPRVELGGALGLGFDGILLEEARDYASTLFTHLRLGAFGRFAIHDELLFVDAGLGGRLGLDGGEIAAAYGPDLLFGGLDLTLGVSGRVEPGFAWALRFGYVLYAIELSGGGGSLGAGATGQDEAVDLTLLLGWDFD